jgi:hypothetical protein
VLLGDSNVRNLFFAIAHALHSAASTASTRPLQRGNSTRQDTGGHGGGGGGGGGGGYVCVHRSALYMGRGQGWDVGSKGSTSAVPVMTLREYYDTDGWDSADPNPYPYPDADSSRLLPFDGGAYIPPPPPDGTDGTDAVAEREPPPALPPVPAPVARCR